MGGAWGRGNRNRPYVFGDLAGGNFARFESDGMLVFSGTATTWRDFNFAAVALGAAASAPDLIQVRGGMLFMRGFDGNSTTEQLFGTLELDHMWKEGSVIKPHVHWMATTAASGNVVWRLTWAVTDPTLPVLSAEQAIYSQPAAAAGEWKTVFTALPDIALSAYHIGAQLTYRLWRYPNNPDGLDTYPDDAVVETFGFHIEQDTIGSREVAHK